MPTRRKLVLVISVLLVFVFSSCKIKLPLVTSATSIPAFTQPPSPTITFTPTPSFTITPSPTITPTATPVLPVDISTPFPSGLHQITADNIAHLREIARTGAPRLRGTWFSRDGKLGFVATTDGLLVYDLVSNQIIKFLEIVLASQEYYPDNRLSPSSKGNRFSVITDAKIEVWDLNTGVIFEQVRSQCPQIAQISADGKLLGMLKETTASEKQMAGCELIIYDIDSGQALNYIPTLYAFGFSFSPNGTWLYTYEGRGAIWRVADWARVQDFPTNYRRGFKGFSPDDRLAVIQDDNYVLIYEVEGWRLVKQISFNIPNSVSESSIEFSPDSSKIGISSAKGVSVYDVPTGAGINDFSGVASPFILSNDGIPTHLQIPEQIYTDLNVTLEPKDGLFLVDSKFHYRKDGGGLIMIQGYYKRNAAEGSYQYKYLGCTMPLGGPSNCQEIPEFAFFNQAGDIYFLRFANYKSIYEVYRGFNPNDAALGKIRNDATDTFPIWISTDNKFLLVSKTTKESSSSTIANTELWNIRSGTLIKKWSGSIIHFTGSPDNNILAFALEKYCVRKVCENNLVVYDVSGDQILYGQTAKPNTIFATLKFAPDGKLIYAVVDDTVTDQYLQIFAFDPITSANSNKGISVKTTNVRSFYISLRHVRMDISPDGNLLALGLLDGTIQVFDMHTHALVHSFKAHHGIMNYLEFTPDGNLLLSASLLNWSGPFSLDDGYIKAWGIWP